MHLITPLSKESELESRFSPAGLQRLKTMHKREALQDTTAILQNAPNGVRSSACMITLQVSRAEFPEDSCGIVSVMPSGSQQGASRIPAALLWKII